MIRIALAFASVVLLTSVSPASVGTFVGNMADGPALLRVQSIKNSDSTYTSWIDINPNIGEDVPAIIEFAVQGELYQSLLTDPIALGVNWGDPNVNFTSQRAFAEILDADYNPARDSVIDGTLWPRIIELELTPDDGTERMFFVMSSVTEGLGGPIPGDEFFPLAHVTTRSRELNVDGYFGFVSHPIVPFSVSLVIPEPSAAVLAIVGTLAVLASARRRRQ